MTAPIRLYMSMSLDGYVTGPDDRAAYRSSSSPHHVDDGDVPPGSARFVIDVEGCAT
jgi:hypothetical protein